MTFDEVCAALIANTTEEEKQEVVYGIYADVMYINHLTDVMGLPRCKWNYKNLLLAVPVTDVKGKIIGQALPTLNSIIINKAKDVKHLQLLSGEKYILHKEECKKRMLDWHKAYKESDYIVKLAEAYCIYFKTPPITDKMREAFKGVE